MKQAFLCFLLAFCLSLTACSTDTNETAAGTELGLDLSSGTLISHSDSHSGIHGDGMTFAVFTFPGDEVLSQIQGSDAWTAFPLDETVTTLVYGVTNVQGSMSSQRGPYIADGGKALIPEIANGYYRLIDRHYEKGITEILERFSFNFTLGIYNADTHTLYYCEFDT